MSPRKSWPGQILLLTVVSQLSCSSQSDTEKLTKLTKDSPALPVATAPTTSEEAACWFLDRVAAGQVDEAHQLLSGELAQKVPLEELRKEVARKFPVKKGVSRERRPCKLFTGPPDQHSFLYRDGDDEVVQFSLALVREQGAWRIAKLEIKASELTFWDLCDPACPFSLPDIPKDYKIQPIPGDKP